MCTTVYSVLQSRVPIRNDGTPWKGGLRVYFALAMLSVLYWPNLASIAHNEMRLITRFYGILYTHVAHVARAHARSI